MIMIVMTSGEPTPDAWPDPPGHPHATMWRGGEADEHIHVWFVDPCLPAPPPDRELKAARAVRGWSPSRTVMQEILSHYPWDNDDQEESDALAAGLRQRLEGPGKRACRAG